MLGVPLPVELVIMCSRVPRVTCEADRKQLPRQNFVLIATDVLNVVKGLKGDILDWVQMQSPQPGAEDHLLKQENELQKTCVTSIAILSLHSCGS